MCVRLRLDVPHLLVGLIPHHLEQLAVHLPNHVLILSRCCIQVRDALFEWSIQQGLAEVAAAAATDLRALASKCTINSSMQQRLSYELQVREEAKFYRSLHSTPTETVVQNIMMQRVATRHIEDVPHNITLIGRS